MDDDEIEEAKRVLVNTLAAVESGELDASPGIVCGLSAALQTLQAL